MSPITVVEKPDLTGKRLSLVLTEDRLNHYDEFRVFFMRTFALDSIGLAEAGYVRAPSGMVFAFVFIGRSGEPFPAGLEIHAVVEALEPLDDSALDRDLWAILKWTVKGVGGEWKEEDLDATARLFRLPVTQSVSNGTGNGP
jgi:hypothetical protein